MARAGAHTARRDDRQRDDERRRALEALPGLAGRRPGRVAGLALAAALAVGACSGVASPADEDAADDVTGTTGAPTTTTGGPTTEAPTTSEAPTTTAAPTTTTAGPGTTAPSTTVAPTTTVPAPPPTTVPPGPEADGTLELGEDGQAVSALQARLTELGYWLGEPDGNYGQLTRQAVMAFQKAEGLGRDGTAGPITQQRLSTASRPVARDAGTNHIEIDLQRQLLLVVADGQVKWAFNTSTGNGEAYTSSSGGSAVAATPAGTFTISREIDGYREAPLGTLYRPKYFNGGIAVHGSGSIPAQPASHGCARLTNAAMDLLWSSGVAAIGTTVVVY